MTTRGESTGALSRRQLVIGGAALAGLGACSPSSNISSSSAGSGAGTSTPAGNEGGSIEGTFLTPSSQSAQAKPLKSTHLGGGRDTKWRIELPSAATPKSLVIMLHGAGHTADRAFEEMDLSPHVEKLGIAIAAVDGGSTWWHWRDGVDGLSMVTKDLVPAALAAAKLPDSTRIGLTGYSMGGYGALLVAAELGQQRVRGIIAHAPALFLNARESPHAFDGQSEFDEFSVWDRVDRLKDIPMWIDCGTEDPFIDNDRRFAAMVPKAKTTFEAGDHDTSVWRPHLAAQFEWLLAQPA